MSNFNLDDYQKHTVTLGGKKYELVVPALGNATEFSKIFAEFDKIDTKVEDDFGGFTQMKAIVKKLFVTPPPEDVLDKMNTVQLAKFIEHTQSLYSGAAEETVAKKK